MLHTPYFDPKKTYQENYSNGPFGAFARGEVYTSPGKPQYEFLGQKLFLPFGIPAGPLLNGTFVKAALDKGFDIATYKTVRSQPYPCHPAPNVVPVDIAGDLLPDQALREGVVTKKSYTEPIAITNSFGVPSVDPDVWQPDMKNAVEHARDGQVVIGSFQGTTGRGYVEDFAHVAMLIQETEAKILEANLSCPNEDGTNMLCFDTIAVWKVVYAIKNTIGNTPLLLKLAYYEDQKLLTDLVKKTGNIVQGFVAINTIPAKIYDQSGQQALPGEKRLISGVCGAPIRWAGLEMVARLKKLREELGMNYAIVASGGVTALDDYKKYRDSGADGVLSATGTMWNPYLAQEMKQALLSS